MGPPTVERSLTFMGNPAKSIVINNQRFLTGPASLLLLAIFVTACVNRQATVVAAHADEGPADRYRIAYQPITYGQSLVAPLPGVAMDYKLVDWDQDGRPDLLATVRRGKGLVWYRNVGSPREPRFRSLEENQVLLPGDRIGSYFEVIDFDGDARSSPRGRPSWSFSGARIRTCRRQSGNDELGVG